MPKNVKESVDLPDFVKESVFKIQILCTFQARDGEKSAWRETRALGCWAAEFLAMKKDLAPYDTRSFMIACKLAVSAVTEL